jgi:3-hydroxyisobutyrate dehydrogenase-like beta-hydroxyacid dehydrogenase
VTAVGFIGLGRMGAPMAQRLVDAGYEVSVWNRTRERAEPLVAGGARLAATPAEAAGASELVLTMVSDANALHAVTDGPAGVLAALRDGAILVEMSTSGPEAVHGLAQRVPRGAGLLDAPVLGSVPEAREGSLRVLVGGEAELVRQARPVPSVLGEPMHVGPLGSGAASKLVANSTLFAVLGALGEAIALSEGLGLSRDAVFDVLAATPLGAQAERRRRAVEERSYPARFTLSLARKDAELVVEAARRLGLDLRMVAAARSWFVYAEEAGLGALDYSAVLAHVLGEAGDLRG